MKKHLIGLLSVMIFFQIMSPGALLANSLDINGKTIFDQGAKDHFIYDERLMVSDEIIKENFFLDIATMDNTYMLSNKEQKVTIEGVMNTKDYRFNGEEKEFPVEVVERNGVLFFPIRGLTENFGDVQWDSEKKQANIRFDFNQFEDIPSFQLVEDRILFETRALNNQNRDNGSSLNRKQASSLLTDGTVVYEKLTNGWLTSVETEQTLLITPQHEDYIIGKYYINGDVTSWIEYPSKSSERDQEWYLYTMNPSIKEDPIAIDKGSFKKLKELSGGEYILDNICFEENKAFYLYFNDEQSKLEVRLASLGDASITTLDELSLIDYPNGTMEVALNNHEAVWTKALFLERYREYGSLFKYEFDSKETSQMFAGCNFLSPQLTEGYLIVRNKPQGENFIVQEHEGRVISGEIWVYDLKHKKWCGKVDNTIPIMAANEIVSFPVVLDDEHMTIKIEGRGVAYDMPIIDFEEACIRLAKNKEGKVLQYSPYELLSEIPFRISTNSPTNQFILNAYTEGSADGETEMMDSILSFYW